ncbi:MAG: glycosyltransferase [Limisphaerales bacterium]
MEIRRPFDSIFAMSSNLDNFQLPHISFIIPTLNVEAILDNCLASIARQTYPRDRYEIILADAHSTDHTREIAKKYGAIVLDDNGKNMEEGKRLALQHATGEFIVFVDADNEITHSDYIELAVKALAANPQALGVESYYLPSPRMSSFCAYITYRLHISDPIAWLMSVNPKLVAQKGDIERWTLPGDSLSYPLGANGFVFRRADLELVKAGEHFQDTHAALHLMRMGKREWLRISGRGVHHYYVQTLWGYIKKTSPGHGAFSSRAGRNARELDERKTSCAIVAGGGLLRHVHRPGLAHVARLDSRC